MEKHDGKIIDADAGEYDGKSLQYRLTEAEKYFGVPLAALSHYAEDATTMLKHRGKTSLIDEIIEASIKVTPNPRCACIVAILITEKAERR